MVSVGFTAPYMGVARRSGMRYMLNQRFSKTTSLLLIATFALAMATTVSAAGVR